MSHHSHSFRPLALILYIIFAFILGFVTLWFVDYFCGVQPLDFVSRAVVKQRIKRLRADSQRKSASFEMDSQIIVNAESYYATLEALTVSLPILHTTPACSLHDPLACSGHGECRSDGTCVCVSGFSGAKCEQCDCRHTHSSYPSCTECREGFGGENCATCAPGYYPSPLCWIKIRCNDTYFDRADVCSGHGQCVRPSSSIQGKESQWSGECICEEGWMGSTCEETVSLPRNETASNNQTTSESTLHCGSVLFNSSNVCSGHGRCIAVSNMTTGVNTTTHEGICDCSTLFAGPLCGECASSRHSYSHNCSVCLTQFSNTIYPACDSCTEGYFYEVQSSTCTACNCSLSSAMNTSCTSEGACFCKPQFAGSDCSTCSLGLNGTECHTCQDGFYAESTDADSIPVCTECQCHAEGAISPICNANSGDCSCKDGWNGTWCDIPRECYGFRFDNSSVCSGNGQCVGTDSCECNANITGSQCMVEWKFSHGSREHYFPTTTGRVDIIDGPDLPHGETYVWTLEVLGANVYWPGREGFNFGVAGFPLADGSSHEVGEFAGEYAFRGRDGKSFTDGVELNFGSILRNTGDQIMFEMNTVSGVLNVYTKRVGSSEFTLEGGKSLFTGVFPTDGRVLRPAVSGICWQPCGVKFVE